MINFRHKIKIYKVDAILTLISSAMAPAAEARTG